MTFCAPNKDLESNFKQKQADNDHSYSSLPTGSVPLSYIRPTPYIAVSGCRDSSSVASNQEESSWILPPEIAIESDVMKGMSGAKVTLRGYDDESDDEDLPKWKKYFRLIFPHVGMVVMCILYTFAGATIFYVIERPHELKVRSTSLHKINLTRIDTLEDLWSSLNISGGENETKWKALANAKIDNLTQILFTAFDNRYVSIEDIRLGYGSRVHWTYPAAVFFAITTVTTIGYGNLVPVTRQGRILCVVFGLLGVPMMLVTIADIGKFISDALIQSYGKFRTFKRKLQRKRDSPSTEKKMREELLNDLRDIGEDKAPIPVTLILLIVLLYTTLGALIFWLVEQKWSFFDSFYFCFITMTTVGFGDFVPLNEAFYVFSLIYIVLGLAITTMCVDLAGTVYIHKIHNFGRKIKDAKSLLRGIDVVNLLKNKYGLTDDQLVGIPLAHVQSALKIAFTPREAHGFRYIDQRTESFLESILTSNRGSAIDGSQQRIVDDNNSLLTPVTPL